MTDQKYEELADFFKLFTSVSRIQIVSALSKQSMSVSEIEKTVDLSQSLVSQQLKLLKNARIVTSERAGKTVIYSLFDKHIIEILAIVLEHIEE